MNAIPKKNDAPRGSYTADAIPEDDERQDELNHRLRKPGEPAPCPPEKNSARVESPIDTQASQK
jgi:hypothetical protein